MHRLHVAGRAPYVLLCPRRATFPITMSLGPSCSAHCVASDYAEPDAGYDRLSRVPAPESNYDHLAGSASGGSADAGWCTMIGL